MKSQNGEIITIIAIIGLVVIGIGTVVGTKLLSSNNKQITSTRAAEACSPASSWKSDCTGKCQGCPLGSGEAMAYQCNAAAQWELKYGQCEVKCKGPCEPEVSKAPAASQDPAVSDKPAPTALPTAPAAGNCTNIGQYNRTCTGQCPASCGNTSGEARIMVCNSNHVWEEKQSECRTECASYCGGKNQVQPSAIPPRVVDTKAKSPGATQPQLLDSGNKSAVSLNPPTTFGKNCTVNGKTFSANSKATICQISCDKSSPSCIDGKGQADIYTCNSDGGTSFNSTICTTACPNICIDTNSKLKSIADVITIETKSTNTYPALSCTRQQVTEIFDQAQDGLIEVDLRHKGLDEKSLTALEEKYMEDIVYKYIIKMCGIDSLDDTRYQNLMGVLKVD